MNSDDSGMDRHASARPIDADAPPSRIEAQLDAKRADIDRTISQLENRFSADRVVDYLKDNGGDIAGNLGRTFKDNPLPFLFTGIGVAWLMSAQQAAQRQPVYPRYRSSRYDGDPRYEEDVSGYRPDGNAAVNLGYAARGTSSADDSGEPGAVERAKQRASAMMDRTGARMDSAGRQVSSVGEDTRQRLERMRDRAEARYQRMSDDARQRYNGMSTSARLHYDRLSDDAAQQYDTLSDDARRQYDQARRKADQAARQIRQSADDLASRSAGFLKEQPLVAAAIGASIGALIGSLLPPSRTEDRYLGAQADRYRDEAREVAGEHMDSLGSQARDTMEQAREGAEKALETASAKAEQAVQRADSQEGGATTAGKRPTSNA